MQVELKEKLTEDKMNYEKEEMRDRYKAMDSLIRAEFLRKDEQIFSIQNLIENQVRGLQNGLRQEEQARNQSENLFREDFLKFQEIFRRVFKLLFKNSF